MFAPLARLLAREQQAFLARNRRGWGNHLARIRDFLGAGLDRTDPERPVLMLGAGSGLEIPWSHAPRGTVGWDADPLSRARTLLRHGRWAPWIFGDITGAFEALRAAAERSARESWSGKRRRSEIARKRLAAILPSLPADPATLRAWIEQHRPGTILAANFLGQLAPLAQRVVERAFAPEVPWENDPEASDPLAEALEQWTERVVQGLLKELDQSGSELWLVHDRAVLEATPDLELGPFVPEWKAQLRGLDRLEAWDPLCGVDVVTAMAGRSPLCQSRWLWPVGPGQIHLVEALAFGTKTF